MNTRFLSISCEDGNLAEEILQVRGDASTRILDEQRRIDQEKERRAKVFYNHFTGKETRVYDNPQLGAMALFLVQRGIDERQMRGLSQGENVDSSVTAALLHGCIELTYQSDEYTTIRSTESLGRKLMDRDFDRGVIDPIYEGLINGQVNPLVYVQDIHGRNAEIILLHRNGLPNIQEIAEYGAVAGQ